MRGTGWQGLSEPALSWPTAVPKCAFPSLGIRQDLSFHNTLGMHTEHVPMPSPYGTLPACSGHQPPQATPTACTTVTVRVFTPTLAAVLLAMPLPARCLQAASFLHGMRGVLTSQALEHQLQRPKDGNGGVEHTSYTDTLPPSAKQPSK